MFEIARVIIVIYINITSFVLISKLKKNHIMIETRRLKNVVIFFETELSFVLPRRIIKIYNGISQPLQLKTFENMKN